MSDEKNVSLVASNLTLAYFSAVRSPSNKTIIGIDSSLIESVMGVYNAFVKKLEADDTGEKPEAASAGIDPEGETSKDRVLRAGRRNDPFGAY